MIDALQEIVVNIIKKEEGFSPKPYVCSEGYATIGYGTKISTEKGADISKIVLRVTEKTAVSMLLEEIDVLFRKIQDKEAFEKLNNSRKAVILSMLYQLGYDGVMRFRKMWEAIEKDDYEEASKEMLDSLWAKQTPSRAKRHADVMEYGEC